MSVWPSGWVCHAVRAPGSNVTLAPAARAGSWTENSGSMRTVPVNHSAGPLPDGCEPARLISMCDSSCLAWGTSGREQANTGRVIAATPTDFKNARRGNSPDRDRQAPARSDCCS